MIFGLCFGGKYRAKYQNSKTSADLKEQKYKTTQFVRVLNISIKSKLDSFSKWDNGIPKSTYVHCSIFW